MLSHPIPRQWTFIIRRWYLCQTLVKELTSSSPSIKKLARLLYAEWCHILLVFFIFHQWSVKTLCPNTIFVTQMRAGTFTWTERTASGVWCTCWAWSPFAGGWRMNLDNMTCIYSTNQGFKVINEEKALVLKDDGRGLDDIHWELGEFELSVGSVYPQCKIKANISSLDMYLTQLPCSWWGAVTIMWDNLYFNWITRSFY